MFVLWYLSGFPFEPSHFFYWLIVFVNVFFCGRDNTGLI